MNISEFDRCSNCGACYNICPNDAISLNEEGLFYRPIISDHLCINCGMCAEVCPVNQELDPLQPSSAFAGWSKEDAVVMNSSSGGVFYGIARKIMDEEGVVFSAAYTDDCKKVIFKSTDETALEKLLKSKYVESLVGLSFRKIHDELDKGRKVLFCGTPCQVAGLKSFLGREYDNLLTCDFACGGVPSHTIYRNYLNCLEIKYKSTVKKMDFRPKTYGWKRYAVRIDFLNGRTYNRLGTEDEYLKSFLYGKYTVRDYCLECKFSDCHVSDLTIADFWLHKQLSQLENDKGISLILCNTHRGKQVVHSLENQYFLSEIDVVKASYNHKKTETSDIDREKHDKFLRVYEEKGLKEARDLFFSVSYVKKIKNCIVRIVCRKRESAR